LIKLWKERIFVLKKGKLYYYKTKKEKENSNDVGFVNLIGSKVEDSENKNDLEFAIVTSQRKWRFKTSNQQEKMEWISAISSQMFGGMNFFKNKHIKG